MNVIKKTKKIRALGLIIWLFILMVTAAPVYADSSDKLCVLSVSHNLVTSSVPADKEFKFRLEPHKADHPMPEGSAEDGYTFMCKETSRIEIRPKSHHQGQYNYKLYQVVDEEKPGYKYDRQVYKIELYVSEVQDTEILVYKEDGTKAQAIAFENEFALAASDPILTVDPPVKKTVTGNPPSAGTFAFNLKAGDLSYPMPPGSRDGIKTVYITGEGEAEFGSWSYTETGTYFYTVYEVDTGLNGYAYDPAVYTITDTVTDENGSLVLSRIVTDNLKKPASGMAFNNIYNNIYETGLYRAGLLPKTWDEMDIPYYITLFVLSATASAFFIAILLAGRKRKKEENQEVRQSDS